MKFTTTRTVENNIFTVSIVYKEYGNSTLTAEEEKKILASFPPVITYDSITFSGNYTVSSKDVVAGGTDTITLTLNNRKVNVNESFNVTYRIDANSIPKSAYSGKTNINTKELLAQAQCKLFEDKIRTELKTVLDAARNMSNNFQTTEDYII